MNARGLFGLNTKMHILNQTTDGWMRTLSNISTILISFSLSNHLSIPDKILDNKITIGIY